MKVTITGKSGYIATNLCSLLKDKGFEAESVSFRNGADGVSLVDTEAVVHCAAIVHKREREYAGLYDKVNHIEAVSLAKKAKASGVKHFVFISTMSVYGKQSGEINAGTELNPVTLYGKSKLAAELEITALNDDNFCVTVLRPPMVYGNNCPGNFATLKSFALKTPVFPKVKNKRSMIYIDNLTHCICNILIERRCGEIMPMDGDYVNTSTLISEIAASVGKKVYLSNVLGVVAGLLHFGMFQKVFGSLYYADDIATHCDYTDFKTAVKNSIR